VAFAVKNGSVAPAVYSTAGAVNFLPLRTSTAYNRNKLRIPSYILQTISLIFSQAPILAREGGA
jgi:hypothetical protein